MRRLAFAVLLFLAALLASSPASASTYYVADCATGGTGSIGDPFCLDADSSGAGAGNGNEWLMTLFDGAGTEAVAGDTIYLCCGGTDGCGDETTTCTITPTTTLGSTFLPDLNAAGNAVTIASYPGDFPVISGDLDGDAVCDAGDATYLLDLDSTGLCAGGANSGKLCKNNSHCPSSSCAGIVSTKSGYHFVGPMVWKRGCSMGLHAFANNADISFDGVTIQEAGSGAWGLPAVNGIGAVDGLCAGGSNVGLACTSNSNCPGSTCNYICYADAAPGFLIYNPSSIGDFTFKNGNLNAGCGMAIRHILGTAGTWLIDNNDIYNNAQVSNDWGNWNWRTNTGQVSIYSNNRMFDNQNGLSFEDRNRYAQIVNNEYACKGIYDISANGYKADCGAQGAPITIHGGDTGGGCPDGGRSGSNADYTISGNRLWGSRWSGAASTTLGWMGGAISINDGCRRQSECTAPGTPWWCCTGDNQWTCNQGVDDLSGDGCSAYYGCLSTDAHTNLIENNMIWSTWNNVGTSVPTQERIALSVNSNTPVTAQNNTLKRNRFALQLQGGTARTPVAHVARNNLVSDSPNVECIVGSMVAPVFENNDCHDTLLGSAVVVTAGATSYTCDAVSGYGTASRCLTPNFVDTLSLDPARWNLRLRFPNVGIINAGSSAGASLDIDGQTRPLEGGYDIGADECPYSAIDEGAQAAPGPVAPIIIRGKVTVP
jgi:hypothetical protein